MAQLIRDSFFGRLLRYASHGKILPFKEDEDPTLLKQYSVDAYNHDAQSSSSSQNYSSDDETAEKGKEDDHVVVGWYGDDDSEVSYDLVCSSIKSTEDDADKAAKQKNPQNWSTFTKIFVTFELCFLTFAVYVGSSIYTMGTQEVMETFNVGEVVATLGLSVFVLGYGLGPMTLAPLSEMPSVGRNPVYVYSLALFVVLQVPTALSTHIAMLVVFRFVTGVLGSPALATGGACIAELFEPRKRALAIGVWGVAAVCGPVLGPLIGGFVAEAKGWRWTIWALMWISAAALVMLFFLLPETSSKNILYRRAQRLRKLTGNERLRTEAEIAFQHVTVGKVAQMTVIRPWILTFQEPVVFLLNLWIALIFGLLFIWFESFPLVFQGIYKFNLGLTGLAFLGLLVGALISIPLFVWYVLAIQEKQFNEKGVIIQPEMRLPPAMVGAICIPVCLFWFGWSADKDIHWIMPMVGTGFFSIGALLVLNSVLTYLPDSYPSEMASVMAGNCFIRFTSGAAFPLFAPAMYERLGIHWTSTLLACLGLLFVPIPFAFYKYGKRLRKASKRARQD